MPAPGAPVEIPVQRKACTINKNCKVPCIINTSDECLGNRTDDNKQLSAERSMADVLGGHVAKPWIIGAPVVVEKPVSSSLLQSEQ